MSSNPVAVANNPLQIDVVSDVVCPWCFIGKRRLENAIARVPEITVTVNYQPYFLNPWVPRGGISRSEYLIAKFGSVERYNANAQRIVMAARDEGLVYNLDAIARQPNTLDCHRLIRWAGESGDAAHMKQRLMDLYFTAGADLTDLEVLVGAARDCGMDAESVRLRLAGDTDVDTVSARGRVRQDGAASTACHFSSLGGYSPYRGRNRPAIWRTQFAVPRPSAPREASRQRSLWHKTGANPGTLARFRRGLPVLSSRLWGSFLARFLQTLGSGPCGASRDSLCGSGKVKPC